MCRPTCCMCTCNVCVSYVCRPTCCIHIYIAATRQHSSTALLHLQVLCRGMMAVQVCQLQKVIFNLPCVQMYMCIPAHMHSHTHIHIHTWYTHHLIKAHCQYHLQMDLLMRRGVGGGGGGGGEWHSELEAPDDLPITIHDL